MSVLIKGMKMPEHCGYCRFRYDGICHALQKTQYVATDCPLIDVPDHGDLLGTIPSAEPKWIPVTERLPEEKQDVLLEFKHNMAVGFWEDILNDGGVAWYANSGNGWFTGTEAVDDDGVPIAWQPLPDPYEYPPKDFMNQPEGEQDEQV